MRHLRIRFYGELNDLVSRERRQTDIPLEVHSGTTIKDAIESMGVPHCEISLIQVNSEPAGLNNTVENDSLVSVFPYGYSMPVGERISAQPSRDGYQFIVDDHLGKLATDLRMLGFSCFIRKQSVTAREMVNLANREDAVLLSRNRTLLMHRELRKGRIIRSTIPDEQVMEVLHRFDLSHELKPFSRCLICNDLLEKAEYQMVIEEAPAKVLDHLKNRIEEFRHCPGCGRLYWPGSHLDRMKNKVNDWLQLVQ